ncbi:MAG: DUF3179 domain-containing protein [Candidatus Saccharimonadales bacterium]
MSKNLVIATVVLVVVTAAVAWLLIDQQEAVDRTSEAPDFVPAFLLRSFPATDWSRTSDRLADALDGGPGKDGIPSIDEPEFEPLSDWRRENDVQAIVMEDGDSAKVYPYNILIWHEIVNDTVNDQDVAITFCPLCGSAIAFNRVLPEDGATTFGVSGGLLESNLIMYDRATESLWQQSTSEALAGKHLGHRLELVGFQLMSVGEAKQLYPDGLILSEDTGHRRDYGRNPYSGYEENERLIFRPSVVDASYPVKDIFVAYRVNDLPVATPWLHIESGQTYQTRVHEEDITLTKEGSQLTITDSEGEEIPFYFEMWFSWAVQNEDNGVVFDPLD